MALSYQYAPGRGYGYSEASGHCGELIQIWARHNGRLKVILSSLPCPTYSTAEVILDTGRSDWKITPGDRTKALRAATLTAKHLGYQDGATVSLVSGGRVGSGMGSSGADCKAAIHATFKALDEPLPSRSMLIELIRASGDSALDSTLVDGHCLTASRTFEVVEVFKHALPPLICLAFDSAPQNVVTTVDTYLQPPSGATILLDYQKLLDAFRDAVCREDLALMGSIATWCALLGQGEVFNPALDEVVRRCEAEGALGVARSFTGTILTALLDPNDADLEPKLKSIATAFRRLQAGQPFLFSTNGTEVYHDDVSTCAELAYRIGFASGCGTAEPQYTNGFA